MLLPHTTARAGVALPAQHAALTAVLGDDPAAVAERLCERAGVTRLRDLGLDEDALDRAAATACASGRELDNTPPRADRAELLALYRAAL